ncbi:NADP-dependent oxidoreductase [Streptomyces sp. MBT27]|uniref:NADP-dependent oxidoreductase n=1 Tax=Streptomyces sp. MBT27 TaxID=1488356 RepID=UPI001421A899|nr:NADP-dependent oxidoreductase [Streptomyces sp. MBT27]
MRALTLAEYGGPELLTVSELPSPTPQAGQILVRTAASGVNPVDLLVRGGAMAANISHPFPLVLGWDLSGTVEAVGAGVDRFAPGDRVVAMSAQYATGIGTHAEFVALPAAIAAPAPRTVDLVEAAALPLAGLTAYQALEKLAPRSGERLLISGAVGAVGGFATQLAASRGVEVIALARPQDAELARELGASSVLSADEPLPTAIADVLLETAGIAPKVIGAVRDGGRAGSIYAPEPPKAERGITVLGTFVEQDGDQLAILSALVDEGVLTLRVAEIGDFTFGPEAHRRLAAGGSRGKFLLTP